ncbi:hypothetical protein [Eubacterium aggregans]|uniref:hypothetical protein n=1 Tax=Eubacterium aggregans TaxID=81409 RepID=UPI003F3DF064
MLAIEEDDAVIATSVRYDEERNISQIDFDLASVDSEKYEIDDIISKFDQVVIYEHGENAETASYEASQNGDYGFLVKYKESVSENNESTTIEMRIKDIQENQLDQQETNNTAPKPLLAVRADVPGVYSQSIALHGIGVDFGEGIKDNSLKTTLTLDPTTYKIKSTPLSSAGYRYHGYYGEQTYYQISVIKKGTPLTHLFEIGQKNELMNVKGIDFVAGYYEKLENYAFEEGDMIQIVSPEGRFYFKGSSLNDGRGNQIDYDTKDVGVEKSYNAVYEITKNGFKEIYNEAPTISGNETPLYGVYGQAKWSSGNALYNGLIFRDDRGPDGKYVAGGYAIKETTGNMNFSVSGNPSSDTTPDVCKAIYNVTDAMGRKGVSKERLIVQLPNIDEKVTIDEMMSKTVNGLLDFPGASINKDSKTVTLKSGVVINADAAKPAISIDYANGSSVKFINRSDGTFSEVQLSDHSTVEADSIESARILNDKSIKLTYKDKKTGKKVIAEITAEGIVTKGYPQSIQLCGTINT